MNIALWMAPGMLTAVFLVTGGMKLLRSKEQLFSGGQGWVEDYSAGTIRLLGVAEVAGAAALVLPAISGVAVGLVPIAATCLALDMAGAVATHVRRKERAVAIVPLCLLVLAVFVAWGRFGPYPL